MPFIRIQLTPEEANRLQDLAIAQRRPTNYQAEVLLRQALGLSLPTIEDIIRAETAPEACHE